MSGRICFCCLSQLEYTNYGPKCFNYGCPMTGYISPEWPFPNTPLHDKVTQYMSDNNIYELKKLYENKET